MGLVPGKERIELWFPIHWEGHEITQIEMRRPKVRDQKGAVNASENPVEQEIHMFSNLSEQPSAVIEELDSADYGRLQKVYQGFLDWMPQTPEHSSST